ncbi:MAG: alpha/beta hydrolase, partial [bacterium]
ALNYNLGGVLDREGKPRPRQLWSYSSIGPLFAWFVAQERLTANTFDLFGHSAGGQFAHRFSAIA